MIEKLISSCRAIIVDNFNLLIVSFKLITVYCPFIKIKHNI